MAIINVTVNDLPESDSIPGGQYRLRIDEVNGPEEDKNGNEYISIVYTVASGEYANRKVNEGYVLLAGKAKLRKILNAISYDKEVLADTDDIIGEELDAIVGMEKSEEYGDQNKIRSYIVPTKKPSLEKAGKKK